MNLRKRINNLKDEKEYSNEQLYLIHDFSKESGFLFRNDKLYYAVKHKNADDDSLSTKYLLLRINIFINTVENSPSFNPGFYDLLIYIGDINDTFFDSFVDLCEMYENSEKKDSFINFFYSLVNLFESPKETAFSNLVGMFGELYFIYHMYKNYNLIIDNNWHVTKNINDKYDFVFNTFNIEVKTTIKEDLRFILKHNQVFNEKNNYVLIVKASVDNSGYSLAEIYDFFRKNPIFANNIDFMIKLQKEKMKVSNKDFFEKKFSLVSLQFYLNKNLDTLVDIPECIDSIEYNYDFIGKTETDINRIVSLISQN